MEVRAALFEDCRAVAAVHVAAWQAAYVGILDTGFLAGLSIDLREASWRQVLSAADSELLLGSEGDSVVGFASFGQSRDADAPPGRGELWALYVHPRSWSTGAGRALWNAAYTRMRSQQFTSISLWVLEGNARAIRFYSVAGFAVEAGSERQFELGGATVREVRMVYESTCPG